MLLKLLVAESNLNESVLKLKAGVNFNYDNVTEKVRAVEIIKNELKKTSNNESSIQLTNLLDSKIDLVNKYKSTNSVLRNAVKSINAILEKELDGSSIVQTDQISRLQMMMHKLILNPNSIDSGVNQEIESFQQLADEIARSLEGSTAYNYFKSHIGLFEQAQIEIISLLNEITDKTIAQRVENQIDLLNSLIEQQQENSLKQLKIATIVMFSMVFIVGLLIVNLIITRGRIEKLKNIASDEVVVKSKKLIEANNKLVAKNQHLIQRQEDLNQVIYALHHEFRSPLRAISTLSEFMKEDLKEGTAISSQDLDKLDKIIDRTARLKNLYDSFIDYLKVGIDDAYELYSVDVMRLANELRNEFEAACDFKVVADVEHIVSNYDLIKMALQQMISNGITHNDNLDKRIELKFQLDNTQNSVYVSVADNGKGIDEKYRKKILKPLQILERDRGEPNKNIGIGLALVNKIVKKLNGELKINSTPERGSEFIIHLNQNT